MGRVRQRVAVEVACDEPYWCSACRPGDRWSEIAVAGALKDGQVRVREAQYRQIEDASKLKSAATSANGTLRRW